MLSFVFANKDSYSDYNILISSRPNLPSPQRRVSYIEVPGKDSSLRYDDGTYEDITIAVECSVKGEIVLEQLDKIKAWLFNALEAELIFSFQPDKKYIAQVVNSIDFKQVYKYTSRFVIIFNCRPFKYAANNEIVTIDSGLGVSLLNPGSALSRPIIKVFGAGSFQINNRELNILSSPYSFITIDSALEEAYSIDEGNLVNANNLISGEYPVLDIGNNIITFSAGITKLEIKPNWRWL